MPQKRIFVRDGSFIVPQGVKKLYVTCIPSTGGGGGGGAGSNRWATSGYGGGGGGGGYGLAAIRQVINVVEKESLDVVIGQGGGGGGGGYDDYWNGGTGGGSGSSGGTSVVRSYNYKYRPDQLFIDPEFDIPSSWTTNGSGATITGGYAVFGIGAAGSVSQVVRGLKPGTVYTLTFNVSGTTYYDGTTFYYSSVYA